MDKWVPIVVKLSPKDADLVDQNGLNVAVWVAIKMKPNGYQ